MLDFFISYICAFFINFIYWVAHMYVNARLTCWQIILSCGKSHEIMNVTEPRHCEYEVLFHTPLVCHQHSMLVYPTLDEALRHRWDTLMSELQAEEITEKVCYNVLITSVRDCAGCLVSFLFFVGNVISDCLWEILPLAPCFMCLPAIANTSVDFIQWR